MITPRLLLALAVLGSSVARTEAENLPAGFVRLGDIAPTIRQDIRYASAFNFTGAPVAGYQAAACILTRPAAMALTRVEARLGRVGLGLVVFDCYRPMRAVASFVAWVGGAGSDRLAPIFLPRVERSRLIALGYISDRSAHSRGSTVDVGLRRLEAQPQTTALEPRPCTQADSADPNGVDLGTTFDCFDTKSHVRARDISAEATANRALLAEAMAAEGFRVYAREWWHFTLRAEPFPDRTFDFDVE